MKKDVSHHIPLIQVIDNDYEIRQWVCTSLKKSGFKVAESENDLTAVSKISQLHPDIILLDTMMPGFNGIDTCRAIREKTVGMDTPIIIMTRNEQTRSIQHFLDVGVTDFIAKPLDLTLLKHRIKHILRANRACCDLIEKQQQIQELVSFDRLTGLANRNLFTEVLEQVLLEKVNDVTPLAVMCLDLDRFKTINDTLGRHIGDTLLRNVAERLKSSVRKTDSLGRPKKNGRRNYVSRLGGDEFIILLPQLADLEDSCRIAQRINKALSQPFLIDEHEIFISASIGASVFPSDGSDAQTLMKYADLAMHHAKDKGKNGFQFYKTSLTIKTKKQLVLENEIRRAVRNEEFSIYYQPQVHMKDGKILGAESLARWNHPKLGIVSPASFIPVIEDIGLITPFTDWVIREVTHQQLIWEQNGLKQIKVAVNVSNKNFVQQLLPDKINKALKHRNRSSEFLEIELTEGVLAERNTDTLEVLKQFKSMGLSISVDDFGTGYSSLAYLKTFPIDRIKIDRFFIKDLLTSVQDAAIVKAIIAMAHSMEMTVVAEGVENTKQLELLRDMGCDIGQGFLFSPAISGKEFTELLRGNRAYIAA